LPFASSELKWTPQRILQTAYHHRRTDACTGSFRGPERERLAELATQLPAREALIELAELGFTTIVVHHSSPRGAGQRARAAMERVLAGPERVVRRVRSTKGMTAYEIELN
jgi:hypothetical protein